jgi:hypothetical protein
MTHNGPCDMPTCTRPGRLYPCGLRCAWHSPAFLAGRTPPAPDFARSAAGLRAAMLTALDQPEEEAPPCNVIPMRPTRVYGHARPARRVP